MIYVHGRGGNASEAEHYKPLFPDCDVIGFDYGSETPWEAKTEFAGFFNEVRGGGKVTVVANSIGAYLVLSSLTGEQVEKAFFISPVVDMEKLIYGMMAQAGVSEDELRKKGNVGELSWEYLTYVKENLPVWNVPTHILYGENDDLTSFETVSDFAAATGSELTVMKNGEHWFHTDEEMEFLDRWIRSAT